jgi:N-methylhydantoinase A/oxoprolinase/acetone carboxylase beta subunit
MVKIANENMANAVRIVTVEQGIDPREFAILAFGGAGPTHAAELADAIGIRRVVVPVNPGLCSAFGTLAAQVRVDAVKSVSRVAERTTGAELDELFRELEEQAQSDFAAQGAGERAADVRRSIAMRYQGQNYEQEVPVPAGTIGDAQLADVVEGYHRLHEEFYGYRFEGIPIELVRISVVVSAPEPALPSMRPAGDASSDDGDVRDVYFPDRGFLSTPIVRWERVDVGWRRGPLVVESMDSTIVVPPDWTLEADESGVLELRKEKAS